MVPCKLHSLLMTGIFFLSQTLSSLHAESLFSEKITYPPSNPGQQMDHYHGVRVEDPYRYLEDSTLEETKQWIHAQSDLTLNYLKQIPQREFIRKKLETFWNYEKYQDLFFQGNRYFLLKNDGLQNQSVIYTLDHLKDSPELLLDPNILSKEGTIALSFYVPSLDGTLLAYGLSDSGSDWIEIKIRNVQTKQDFTDKLKWVKFSSVAWHPEGKGLYYCRYDAPHSEKEYDEPNYQQRVYFHQLGTNQEEDILIYEHPQRKECLFDVCVSDDEKYLIITARQGCDSSNGVFMKEIFSDAPVKELFPHFDAEYVYIGNKESFYWFRTNHQANRQKVIGLDLKASASWTEVIPEKDEVLTEVNLVGDRLIAHYLKNAHSHIQIFHLNGNLEKTLPLPSVGTVSSFSGKKSDKESFYAFTSFTQPRTIFRYDFINGESQVIYHPSFPVSCQDYETKQVFYSSKDGAKIPMFLCYKKGIKQDGQHPVYLYGYGGFDVALTPSFSPHMMAWMDLGGVYAVANLRGGGEFGKAWHDAGKLLNKQNVFDDFIAAAEWLIAQKYTCPSKLAISGASNGGLLVAACLNQRPELFGAALPAVGVMDMLRFHQFTIGWAWISEYGSSDDPKMFPYLYRYSPLHNIKKGTAYPPTLILTAEKDDRVVPAHSFKYAATLQEAQSSSAPILIRIETSAGHGAGKPLSKMMDEKADQFAFLFHHLKMKR